MIIFSDKTLSKKLERAEARFNAAFVESRARLFPESGAAWIDVGGTYAMFDGAESPCTQTFGLGLFGDATDDAMGEIEAFFKERGAPVFHEVSPLADPATIELLNRRGYSPVELTSVMFMPIGPKPDAGMSNITTRVIDSSEADVWTAVSAEGWLAEMPELADFFLGLGKVSVGCAGASALSRRAGRPADCRGDAAHRGRSRPARRCEHHSLGAQAGCAGRIAGRPSQACGRKRLHARFDGRFTGQPIAKKRSEKWLQYRIYADKMAVNELE